MKMARARARYGYDRDWLVAKKSAGEYAEVDWHEFLDEYFPWLSGEHITLIGPTGSGKTTLTDAILPLRKYVLFFATKERDDTIKGLVDKGYRIAHTFDEIILDISSRWILKPLIPKEEQTDVRAFARRQKEVFRDGLMRAFRQGGWTLVLDEVRYLTKSLGLSEEVEIISLQGRSEDVTLVAGTQRPRFVPLEVYANATYLFLWRNPDMQDVERVAEMVGTGNRREIASIVANLPFHHVLCYNVKTGEMVSTVVE